jgi:hypothetical protein
MSTLQCGGIHVIWIEQLTPPLQNKQTNTRLSIHHFIKLGWAFRDNLMPEILLKGRKVASTRKRLVPWSTISSRSPNFYSSALTWQTKFSRSGIWPIQQRQGVCHSRAHGLNFFIYQFNLSPFGPITGLAIPGPDTKPHHCLNASTLFTKGPHFLIFLFSLSLCTFLAFFWKNSGLLSWFCQEDPIPGIYSMEGGVYF